MSLLDDNRFNNLNDEQVLIYKSKTINREMEEWLERCHDVVQLGVVGYLVDKAEPAPDVGCGVSK